MQLSDLKKKIETKQALIGVVGLGYVGLPVATMFASRGFQVVGVDLKPERVTQINQGQSPIDGDEPGLSDMLGNVVAAGRLRATTGYAELQGVDVFLIDVETPVDHNHTPRYEALRSASRSVGGVMKAGALVIVESTIAPGTTENVVVPLLEQSSGKKAGQDFYLGVCPERVMPGKLLKNLREVNRICGGDSLETAQVLVALYSYIVQADLDPTDLVTAEVVKTAENAYRDVQIAFANEVALICEAVGADVWKVRALVNKVPQRQMHLPGGGVGGHCITKDPWLLAYGAAGKAALRLIPAARAVNDGMPHHVAELTCRALSAMGRSASGARVAILGFSYLENSGDIRNSPSKVLQEHLLDLGAEVVVHDPWVEDFQGDLLARIQGCDAMVIMVAHKEYLALDLAALKQRMAVPLLIDARHVLDKEQVQQQGWFYWGVGVGDEN